MIKLTRPDPPSELTDEVIKQLTAEYKASEKPVWSKKYIREALLKMSHGKCCYSEFKVNAQGRDLTIDHFHPKSEYPEEVVVWENLLPASHFCNRAKGNWDTKKDPIIDPTKDDPKDHLILQNFRFYPKTSLGKNTIQVLNLNDRIHLSNKRAQIGLELSDQLEKLLEQVEEYDSEKHSLRPNRKSRKENRYKLTLRKLLLEGIETAEFSATVATVLLNEANYKNLKALFKKLGLWGEEIQSIETHVSNLAFEINR